MKGAVLFSTIFTDVHSILKKILKIHSLFLKAESNITILCIMGEVIMWQVSSANSPRSPCPYKS